jgi:hypothetical protein
LGKEMRGCIVLGFIMQKGVGGSFFIFIAHNALLCVCTRIYYQEKKKFIINTMYEGLITL